MTPTVSTIAAANPLKIIRRYIFFIFATSAMAIATAPMRNTSQCGIGHLLGYSMLASGGIERPCRRRGPENDRPDPLSSTPSSPESSSPGGAFSLDTIWKAVLFYGPPHVLLAVRRQGLEPRTY